MVTKQRCQTTAPLGLGMLSLPGSENHFVHSHEMVLSPYFQRSDFEEGGTRQEYSIILGLMIKGFFTVYIGDNPMDVTVVIIDSAGTHTGTYNAPIAASVSSTGAILDGEVVAAANTYLNGIGIPTPDSWEWLSATPTAVAAMIAAALPVAPSSYQTIVSQTGTAAPAVSGSLSPVSTYPSGTTFTWARTGAGVYTLTASTAVFNTAGKTGVFVSQLQNLNANVKAVVTSTTVITITTAVQSVAVLGLLGLTTTNTDALLSGTMLYVQTYA